MTVCFVEAAHSDASHDAMLPLSAQNSKLRRSRGGIHWTRYVRPIALVLIVCACMYRWANAIVSNRSEPKSAHHRFGALDGIAEHAQKAEAIAATSAAATAARAQPQPQPPQPPQPLQAAAAAAPPLPDRVQITFDISSGGRRTITLRLLPENSAESVAFLREAGGAACRGELYRSESFLVQGRISCGAGATRTKVVKAGCPAGVTPDRGRRCPSHDPHCGCHGPIMTRGMVGWAGGGGGPDFFVYTGRDPATHWAHDHTVFAVVEDEASWATLDAIAALPTQNTGMTMLVRPLPLVVSAGGGEAAIAS